MIYDDKQPLTTPSRIIRLAAAGILSISSSVFAGNWDFVGDPDSRAAAVAEGLALRETSGFLAEESTAATIRADLSAIYAAYPGVATASVWPDSGNSIIAMVDPAADQDAIDAAFPAELGLADVSYLFGYYVVFHFDAPINAANLAAWAEANVPGILSASPDSLIGDGHDVQRVAEKGIYAFKLGTGDCPAGCINESWRYVLMTAEGPVEVGADVIGEFYPGDLRFAVEAPIRVSPGDTMALERFAEGSFSVRHGGTWITDEVIDFSEPASFGTYLVTVRRPLGLSSVEHRVEFVEREGGEVLGGWRELNGWVYSEDFGWAHDQSFPWVWHQHHGWMYLHPTAGNADLGWAYDAKLGWMALMPESYPWVYSADRGWLYYQPGTAAPRIFFDSAASQWLTIE